MKTHLFSFYFIAFTLLTCHGQSSNQIPESESLNKEDLAQINIDNGKITALDDPKIMAQRKKAAQGVLDNVITDVFNKSTVIELLQLDGFVAEGAPPVSIEGYPVLSHKLLSEQQSKELKQVLADSSTYILGEGVKHCLFLPTMGFRVFLKDNSPPLNVIMSLHCNVIQFSYQNSIYVFNSDPGYERLKVFQDLFPKKETTENVTSTEETVSNKEAVMEQKKVKKVTDKKTVPTEKETADKAVNLGGVELAPATPSPVLYIIRENDNWIKIAYHAFYKYPELKTKSPADLWVLNDVKGQDDPRHNELLTPGKRIIIGYESCPQ